jgi:nitroreductase
MTSPTLGLTSDELLTTTRSVRKRLDYERPVDRAVVEECLSLALQAPNGSNQQEWQWVVVDDGDVKAQLADLYREGMTHFGSNPYFAGPTPDWGDPALQKIGGSARSLMDNLHRVPVMVIPTIEARPEGIDLFLQANLWGSILPAVWSFMLALRDRGLGSAWTTVHLHREREAADLLGIPHDRYTQAGLFPVAYTLGTDFRPGPRRPLAEVLHWNHWST